MEKLAVLSMVKRELQRKRITTGELSHALKINHFSVAGLLKIPTFQVQRLGELSEFLNYNFFRELSAQYPYTEPGFVEESKQSEVEELKNRGQRTRNGAWYFTPNTSGSGKGLKAKAVSSPGLGFIFCISGVQYSVICLIFPP